MTGHLLDVNCFPQIQCKPKARRSKSIWGTFHDLPTVYRDGNEDGQGSEPNKSGKTPASLVPHLLFKGSIAHFDLYVLSCCATCKHATCTSNSLVSGTQSQNKWERCTQTQRTPLHTHLKTNSSIHNLSLSSRQWFSKLDCSKFVMSNIFLSEAHHRTSHFFWIPRCVCKSLG